MKTYQEIKNVLLKKGYLFSSNDKFPNVVPIRTSEKITNHFTDELYLLWKDGEEEKIISIPFTTMAGLNGAFLNPITVNGITGTAVIEFPQQCINTHEFHDTYTEFSHAPYFRQVKELKYWRDKDKDTEIDHIQEEIKNNGTHLHVMSNEPPAWQSGNVNEFSLGCMGAPWVDWFHFVDTIRPLLAIWGKFISPMCLMESDFE